MDIFLGFWCTSGFYRLNFFIRYGKFSAITSSNVIPASFPPLFLGLQHMCASCRLQFSGALCLFFHYFPPCSLEWIEEHWSVFKAAVLFTVISSLLWDPLVKLSIHLLCLSNPKSHLVLFSHFYRFTFCWSSLYLTSILWAQCCVGLWILSPWLRKVFPR